MSKKSIMPFLIMASLFQGQYTPPIRYNNEPTFKQAFNKHRKNAKKKKHK